jgi:hypothetical protein
LTAPRKIGVNLFADLALREARPGEAVGEFSIARVGKRQRDALAAVGLDEA